MSTKPKTQISVRLPQGLIDDTRQAIANYQKPYAPTFTQLVERGLVLSLREFRRKKAAPSRRRAA